MQERDAVHADDVDRGWEDVAMSRELRGADVNRQNDQRTVVREFSTKEQDLWKGRVLAVAGILGWPTASLFQAIYGLVYYVAFDQMLVSPIFIYRYYATVLIFSDVGCIIQCSLMTLSNVLLDDNIVRKVLGLVAIVLLSMVWAGACRFYARAHGRRATRWAIAGFFFLWWAALAMSVMNWQDRRRTYSPWPAAQPMSVVYWQDRSRTYPNERLQHEHRLRQQKLRRESDMPDVIV